MSGERFSMRKALGSAANGAVVGAVKGALVSSGAGIGLSLAADFIGGTAGSALEQKIGSGSVSLKESLVGGVTNAVSGAIYGKGPLKGFGDALMKGAASGAATAGIRYLARDWDEGGSDLAGSVLDLVQGVGQMALSPYSRNRDPRRGCGVRSSLSNRVGEPMAYGYRYDVGSLQKTGSVRRKKDGFSMLGLLKEAAVGGVMGGLAGTAFYGAGKAFGFLKDSVRDVRGNKGGSSVGELTISSRNTSRGKPNAINHFGEDLNARQRNLLNQLPEYDSSTIVRKSSVNLNDLSALTAKTGDEFAMFTRGSQRMIIRGGPTKVNINSVRAQELASVGYRWSGHTHPGIGDWVKTPSAGDKLILNSFKQTQSAIYDSAGKFQLFGEL